MTKSLQNIIIYTTSTHSWCEIPLCGGCVYAKTEKELIELLENMGFIHENTRKED